MKRTYAILAASTAILMNIATGASAALVISDLSISSTDLSFDVTGTVDSNIAPNNFGHMFFGFEDPSIQWVNSGIQDNGTTTHSGDYDPQYFYSYIYSEGYGNFVYTYDSYTFAAGDQVDFTLSVTGSFDPNAFIEEEFKVQVGYSYDSYGTGSIVKAATVGGSTIAPVPLPASLPLLLVGLGGMAALRRRAKT